MKRFALLTLFCGLSFGQVPLPSPFAGGTGGGGGGGATIPSTTNALKGDGSGNGAAVTGAAGNCVHVDGNSGACPVSPFATGANFVFDGDSRTAGTGATSACGTSPCTIPTTGFVATTTGTASSGSTALTVASGTGIGNGQGVFGAGIAPGTTVSSVSGTAVTLSLATVAALSTTPVSFGNMDYPSQAMRLGAFSGRGTGYNLGVGGDTCAQIASRYSSDAHTLSPAVTGRPGYFFVNCGTNDEASSATAIAAATAALWALARADGYTVIAITNPNHATTSAVRLVNDAYNDLTRSYRGFWDYLLDMQVVMNDVWNPNYFSSDQTHFINRGYAVWAQAAAAALTLPGAERMGMPENRFQPLGTGTSNSRLEENCLYAVTSGSGNVCAGYGSFAKATTIANSIAFGNNACPNAIGPTAVFCLGAGVGANLVGGFYVVLIGGDETGDFNQLVSIGVGASVTGSGGTAVGTNSVAAANSTALGIGASSSTFTNSTAIGQSATNTANHQVMLGTSAETVSTPGRIDDTAAASTAPAKTGTSLPGTCAVGDLYFKSDATAGQNIYQCQSTNTWTQQLNSGSGGANNALSNLASVSINTALIPQSNIDIGSAANPFRFGYFSGISMGGATSACDGTAGCDQLGQGTAPSALPTTGIQFIADTSVTSYRRIWANNISASGFSFWTRATSPVLQGTETFVGLSGTGNVCMTTNCLMTTPSMSSPTMTGTPTAPTPSQMDNSTKVPTTAYVDLAVSNAIAGVNPAIAVLAASTANLTGTYSNGVSGIGATFTVTATGVFTLDGITINTIGQRVLLKNQSSAFQNGMYTATIVGAVAVSPVFTRALDYDTPSDINTTGAIPVQSGTVNSTTSWLLTSTVSTVGTDALTYVQFSIAPSNITQTIASGTSALGTGAISSGACATVVTTTATGTASTDAIAWTPNASIKAVTGYVPATTGGLSIAGYPTSNAVNWDVCNWTSGSITPGAVTLNWRVTR